MMPTKQKILELGSEGGGATIFRLQDSEGKPVFQFESVFLTLDENDDEDWKTVLSQPYPTFSSAMDRVGPNGNWVRLTPLWIHPEFKDLIATMVKTWEIQNGALETECWASCRDRWMEWLEEN